MTRIQLACYALIASAMVLAGLLVTTTARQLESTAQADMVVTKDVFTVLTALGISTEQFIYMLDNKNERLFCYTHKPNNRLELFGSVDIGAEMRKVAGQGGNNTGAGNRYSR